MEEKQPLQDDANDALVGAYFSRILGAADATRSRAQGSYAIASALAGSAIAVGLVKGLVDLPSIAKGLGIAAAAIWILSALLFLRVLGPSLRPADNAETVIDKRKFARTLFDKAKEEHRSAESRLRQANAVLLTAVVLTGFTAAAALLQPGKAKTVEAKPSATSEW